MPDFDPICGPFHLAMSKEKKNSPSIEIKTIKYSKLESMFRILIYEIKSNKKKK